MCHLLTSGLAAQQGEKLSTAHGSVYIMAMDEDFLRDIDSEVNILSLLSCMTYAHTRYMKVQA